MGQSKEILFSFIVLSLAVLVTSTGKLRKEVKVKCPKPYCHLAQNICVKCAILEEETPSSVARPCEDGFCKNDLGECKPCAPPRLATVPKKKEVTKRPSASASPARLPTESPLTSEALPSEAPLDDPRCPRHQTYVCIEGTCFCDQLVGTKDHRNLFREHTAGHAPYEDLAYLGHPSVDQYQPYHDRYQPYQGVPHQDLVYPGTPYHGLEHPSVVYQDHYQPYQGVPHPDLVYPGAPYHGFEYPGVVYHHHYYPYQDILHQDLVFQNFLQHYLAQQNQPQAGHHLAEIICQPGECPDKFGICVPCSLIKPT